MMVRRGHHHWVGPFVLALVAVVTGTTATTASARTAPAPTRLHACVTKSYSKFKIVAPKKRCPRGQRKVSWALGSMKESRPGADGTPGQAGAPGPQGASGPPGERGPEGPSTGAAGGDLAGSFPNPTIAAGAVTGDKVAPGTISGSKLLLPLELSSPADVTQSPLSVRSDAGGSQPIVSATSSLTTAIRPAIYGEISSMFANFGTAGVYGRAAGTGGVAGLFSASNPAGNSSGLLAIASGTGDAVKAHAKSGDAVEASVDTTGDAIYGWVPSFGDGRPAVFSNFNGASTKPVVTSSQNGTGDHAVFRTDNGNVARINAAGRGFFNGGTQVSGADLAEAVPTCGARPRPGDVVEIDPQTPDCFRIASSAQSSRVAGVISTDPGVMLGAKVGDPAGPSLALAGRVPVRVSGPIRIGDLLVASDVPGHARRADDDPAPGSVIGKALEANDRGSGTVKMLVMVR
jgi:hypothetical protein